MSGKMNNNQKANEDTNQKTEIAIIDERTIRDKIYVIRGEKVMLDFELAEIYGYTTKAFNQQVKNNIGKFDDDFRFQVTKEEFDAILRSKNLTSSWGGSRYLPWCFTESGVYMLMTVLRGELATQQSKALIRVFRAMKNFIADTQGSGTVVSDGPFCSASATGLRTGPVIFQAGFPWSSQELWRCGTAFRRLPC